MSTSLYNIQQQTTLVTVSWKPRGTSDACTPWLLRKTADIRGSTYTIR